MGTDYTTQFITGKNVCANGFDTLGEVEINRIVKSNAIYDSSGQGGADRPLGNVDFTGSFRAWGRQPPAGIYPNKLFNMLFTLSGASGEAVGSGGAFVMCTGLHIIVPVQDPQEENAVNYVVDFGAAGNDITYGLTPPAAINTLSKYPVQGLTMSITNAPVAGVEHMEFHVFQQGGRAEPNSTTNGVCFRPIANIDYRYIYRVAVNNMTLLPTLNTIVGPIIMQTDGSNGWTSTYGRVVEHEGVFSHDNEKIVAVKVHIAKCKSGTSLGTVLMPGGTQIWPQT